MKPSYILDRGAEWEALNQFIGHPDPQLRIGVVSGRRRVGKSYLLRALAEAHGGLYVTAVAEESVVAARRRFAEAITRYAGLGSLRAADPTWEELLIAAIDVVTGKHDTHGILVIDELPYWLAHSPEIAGLLQLQYDQSQVGQGPPGGRVILCGSAISVMESLLSGTKALRGRAAVDLRLGPFDLRTTAAHWGIGDPDTALRLHSVLGGAPGYRNLSSLPAPQSVAEFNVWIPSTVLNPGQAIFSRAEAEYLLREDPKFSGQVLHYGILAAVANGANTPAKIGGLIERDRTMLARPVEALASAGYLAIGADLLWQRKPQITIADPIIRFHNLIAVPQTDLIEAGQSVAAWDAARATFASRVLGPHLEGVCRDWTRRFAGAEALGGARPGKVGSTVVNDRSGQARHEIDVLAVDPGYRPGGGPAPIRLIGEVKATSTRCGTADLNRLVTLRESLGGQGHQTVGAVLALYSLSGFYPDLVETARQRGDVLLVDLAALMGEAAPLVMPR